MSCAVFTFLGWYATANNKGNTWIVSSMVVATVFMFIVASFLAWKEQYEKAAEERRPKFLLESGAIVSHYEGGKTLVLLGLRITNAGADSAVLGYGAIYQSVVGKDPMQLIFLKNDKLTLTMPNGTAFTFRGKDAINLQTGPIQRGDVRIGRLPLVIDGNKIDDIATGKSSILVTVRDYLNNEYSTECRGTGHSQSPVYMAGEPIDPQSQEGMIIGNPSNPPKNKPFIPKKKHRRR